jgi:hypothetical protein
VPAPAPALLSVTRLSSCRLADPPPLAALQFALEGVTKSPSAQFTLQRMADTVQLEARLAARRRTTVEEFEDALRRRETAYGAPSFTPTESLDTVGPNTYYLSHVDALHRRVYEKTASA